jgi:hypothetical protein
MGNIIELPKPRIALASFAPIRADQLRFRFFQPFRPQDMDWRHSKRPVHWTKSNSWENGLLLLLFNNTNFALVGDATGLRGSSTAGSLYLSLHTADPGEAGDQTTSEIGYTSYARKAISRASGAGGFTVSGNSCTLTDALTSFVAGSGGSGTATHFGIGTASSGAGVLLYSGTVTPNIVTGNGITPQLTSATAVTED